tara:strand:- start:384 stop:1784 length:1401 start_codon:yes stop_codon:yes gene_type:complete
MNNQNPYKSPFPKSNMTKIGLEIHGYLDTKEKLFCNCSNQEAKTKNTNICPVCTGQPGSKPLTPNTQAIKKSIQIALMLGTKPNTLPKKLAWQRKHYSWPDLPKGYQNTLSGPYATHIGQNGKFLGIRITELHLEEDPAAWDPVTGCIDYNRSGSPLIEIVTEPDFTSSEQVSNWLKNLIITLSYIKAINKKSGIKADVNVNIEGISKRTEVKNVHSIKDIVKVIESELIRHKKEKPKSMETRRWNTTKNKTDPMRQKEGAADYRFITDPDLPVIKITNEQVKKIKSQLPETPEQKLIKLTKKHKIDKKNATILTKNLELVDFFESLAKHVNAKQYIPWVTIELLRVLNYNKKTLDEVTILPEHLAELIKAVDKKHLTVLKAKQTMNKFIPKSFSIKDKKDLNKISDKDVETFCKQAIKKNPKAVADYKSGEKNALNFLIGNVMQLSNRRADFQTARKILEKLLKN